MDAICLTRREKRCKILNKFKFREYRKLKNGNFNYRCTNKFCNASITVNNNNEIVDQSNADHKHDAYSDQIISREIVRSSLKRKAENDLHTRPNKLIRQELKNTDVAENMEHGDLKLIRRSIYYVRKKHFPTLPSNFDESLKQLLEMKQTLLHKGNQFCFSSDDNSVILFTCKNNLEVLCDNEHVFGDGTFTYAPKHFMQLYTIHVYTNYYYLPLVYCFLKNKQVSTYVSMWKTIMNLSMILIEKNLNVKTFHADFEKAAHIAVLQSFPQCKIICCTFHLGQSWFRHLKKNKTLLKEYSKNDSEIGRWLKYFFGLPYLNSDEVPDAFTELISIAPSNISMDFPDYILKNYIDFDADFGPELWASAPDDSPRTTNGAENFHMHFNSQFYTPHPHIHQIIQILMEIQVDTDLKINSLKKNKENTRRTEILKKQNFLKKIYSDYKSKKK